VRSKRQKFGFCKTRESVSALSSVIMHELLRAGVPAVLLPTCSLVEQCKGRISKFNLKPVRSALKHGLVPVLSGDMVFDSALGGSVCSGDQVISCLSSKLKISRVVFATDVDGIFTADPKKKRDAKLIECVSARKLKFKKSISRAKTTDVTGGMRGKVAELSKIRSKIYVANALKPERIYKLLVGKKALSTRII